MHVLRAEYHFNFFVFKIISDLIAIDDENIINYTSLHLKISGVNIQKNMVEHVHGEILGNDQITRQYSLPNLIVNRDRKYVHLGAGIFPKIRIQNMACFLRWEMALCDAHSFMISRESYLRIPTVKMRELTACERMKERVGQEVNEGG